MAHALIPHDFAVLSEHHRFAAVRDLPAVLSAIDVDQYARIMAAQNGGDWTLADKLIGELRDQRLLGYVLADRYLSPRYKASYTDLVQWLRNFGDLVDAPRIHALATKLRPAHAAAPPVPVVAPPLTGTVAGEDDAGWLRSAARRLRFRCVPAARHRHNGLCSRRSAGRTQQASGLAADFER